MTGTEIHPLRIVQEIILMGRRRATSVSVQETVAIAQTLITMTQIVDDTAGLILAIEDLGESVGSKTTSGADAGAVLERLSDVRKKIEAVGILPADASQRRPTDGEAKDEQGNDQGSERARAPGQGGS